MSRSARSGLDNASAMISRFCFKTMVASVLLVGCATRSVPDRFPANSAASPGSPEGAAARTTRALEEDPPLPGESIEGWDGLQDADAASGKDVHALLQQALDADGAVRVALLNNRELRATLREVGIARGHLLQAGLLPNPVAEVEMLPERNTAMELRVEFDLTTALLAPRRSNAARPEVEAARIRAAAAVIAVGYRVRVGFYRLQSAQQRLRIAQQVLDGYAAARDAARAMASAGNIPELDLANQEAAFERGRIIVAQLALEVATERECVQRLLGTHGPDAQWRVETELGAVPDRLDTPTDLETRALRASLELSETRHRLESIARRTGVARTEGWLPDIAIDAHGLRGNPEADATGAGDPNWGFGAGISVGVPIFNRRQGTRTALEAEFDALMERYHGMAIDLRSAAREARNRVESAHARARHYQQIIVPAQERVTEQTLLQYNAMQIGIYQIVQARREALDVKLAEVETLREYWSAVAELKAILAGKRVESGSGAAVMTLGGASESRGGH
jgi:outer membrane protein, heavy metal efflux system